MNQLATVYELPDLVVFDVSGADAVSFIQGQITNDIAGVASNCALLAGYCTAQGRLLATMVLHHALALDDGTPVLRGLIKQDILTPVIKRLSMFVLRAKAKFTVNTRAVRGLCIHTEDIASVESLLACHLPHATWEKVDTNVGTWIAAPASTNQRWWLISSEEQSKDLADLLTHCSVGNAQDWHALDIGEGLPWIEAATQDMFIPQTLNLDLIQGVSFTKGCYPGQEIVARSHYRGTVKRRMVAAIAVDHQKQDTAEPIDTSRLEILTPGADIYDGSREDHISGRIINVALTDTKTHLLIESSFEAVDHAQLRAISANGPALRLEPLPYAIRPEPIEK